MAIEQGNRIAQTVSKFVSTRSRPINLIVLGIGLLWFSRTLDTPYASFFASILLGSGVALEIFSYLQLERRRSGNSFLLRREDRTTERLTKDVGRLKSEYENFTHELRELRASSGKTVFTETERLDIQQEIKKSILNENAKEYVEAVKVAFNKSLEEETHLSSVRKIRAGIISRLQAEILNLGRRANVNLVIGILISMFGIYLLYDYVNYRVPQNISEDMKGFIGSFLIRISLITFVEIFAYFFLRLYRHSLFEIKHYQNEITNSEFRLASLEVAMSVNDTPILMKICEDFLKTERNFLVKKGKSTLTLRQLEIEQSNDRVTITVLKDTIASLKGVLSQVTDPAKSAIRAATNTTPESPSSGTR